MVLLVLAVVAGRWWMRRSEYRELEVMARSVRELRSRGEDPEVPPELEAQFRRHGLLDEVGDAREAASRAGHLADSG